MDESQAITDSQDSPRPGLGGSHHLPPYNILLCLAIGRAPKCHFVMGLPSGSLEIPKVETPTTLGAHKFV